MPKYTVVSVFSVDVSETIEAGDPGEAVEESQADFSLCYHCAKQGNLGEIFKVMVLDEDGEELEEWGWGI